MDNRFVFFALVVAGLGVVAALMVVPFVPYLTAAALLAFVLYPAQRRLRRRLGARPSATLLVGVALAVTVVPIFLVSAVVLNTAQRFADQADELLVAIEETRRLLEAEFDVDLIVLEELTPLLGGVLETLVGELSALVSLSIRVSVGVLVLVFVLYYLLVDGETFVAWLREVAPLDDPVQEELIEEINTITWAVLGSHVFVAIVEGILGGIALFLAGVPNAAFWTVVMVIASILPIVGVWLVWAPVVAYLFFVGQPITAILLLLYGVTVLAVIDNYLRAIFVDVGSGLHPAVVLVGVIGGIYLFGVVGLFLGPILLAVFKASVNVFARISRGSGPAVGS